MDWNIYRHRLDHTIEYEARIDGDVVEFRRSGETRTSGLAPKNEWEKIYERRDEREAG